MTAYLAAATMAFSAVGLLGVTLRVALPLDGPRHASNPSEDYGLLRPIAEVESTKLGECVQGMLRGSGIRATLAKRRDGRVRVLVFDDEYDRARRLVSWAL